MKIGIDCRLWSETGVGRYIRNLVLNLQKLDEKNDYILFVLPKDRGGILKQVEDAPRGIQNDKFKIVEADIGWHTIAEQLKFPKILDQENLDLVHFPYFSVPIFYNRPFVVTIHDLIMHHFSTGQASTHSSIFYRIKLLGYKYVISQAARKAQKIIAVSNATKDEIVDHLKINPQKIAVSYEGADDKISNLPTSSRSAGLRGASKITNYFLYVGNAYPHKNLDRLLEAFKKLNSDVNLVLVGKEDYFYKRLKRKSELMDLSKKVFFLQNVRDEELSNLYQNALALIVPSLMEGFGLPALEAMANNCLVLASDIPVLREVCGDGAIYFDPYNVKDIAQKMKDVYLNNIYHLSEKKEQGLERAKLFSWEKMAKETLKVYESSM